MLLVHTWGHARGGDSTHVDALQAALETRGCRVARLQMAHPSNRADPDADLAVPRVDWDALDGSLRGARALGALARAVPALVRTTWNREAADRSRRLAARFRPDVVHAHHLHHHLTPSVLAAARGMGLRTVWTLHDYELVCPNGLLYTAGAPCEACAPARYHEAVLRRCKRDSAAVSLVAAAEKAVHRALRVDRLPDVLVCPSLFLRDRLARFGATGREVHHLPHFVPDGWIPRGPALPPPAGAPLLFAGRLAREKGVDVLIEAAAREAKLRVDIAGDGPERAHLQDRAASLGLGGRVRFLGRIPPEAVRERLDACLAAVVPSRWPENFPFAVLEPMARGRPVVASAVGGIPEQFEDGSSGVLVPPADPAALADACAALAADPTRALAIGRAALAAVERRYAEGPYLDRLLALYAGDTRGPPVSGPRPPPR